MKPWTKASLISTVLLGITVGGSWLRAISVTPVRSIPSARIDMVDMGKTISPIVPFTPLQDIPKEMLWFFVLYPQVSDQSKIQFKNWHAYTVEDSASEQRYVVSWTIYHHSFISTWIKKDCACTIESNHTSMGRSRLHE